MGILCIEKLHMTNRGNFRKMIEDVDHVRDRQEGGEDVVDHGVDLSQEDRELREKTDQGENEAEIVHIEMKDLKNPRSIEDLTMNKIDLMMNLVDCRKKKDR